MDNPRDIERSDYLIGEILFTAVLAMMCGATSYQDFSSFAASQIDWLRKWIPMEHGAASHDTYRRVFQFLPPESLTECLRDMFNLLEVDAKGDHVALDGKKFRGCFNKKGQSLLNSVGAYAIEHGICLTQKATKNEDGKEVGEMKTIPDVVRSIDVTDTLVTVDAGGCYSDIAEVVIAGGGDYAIGCRTSLNNCTGCSSITTTGTFGSCGKYKFRARFPSPQQTRRCISAGSPNTVIYAQ